jgi:hypothetical protein
MSMLELGSNPFKEADKAQQEQLLAKRATERLVKDDMSFTGLSSHGYSQQRVDTELLKMICQAQERTNSLLIELIESISGDKGEVS